MRETIANRLLEEYGSSQLAPFIEALLPEGWLNRILKNPDARTAVEWQAMELGRAAGFTVPAALLVERFDIRTGMEDNRRLALEDMSSVLDVPAPKNTTAPLSGSAPLFGAVD